MLSIKRFSVVQGRAGIRSFLQSVDYSPVRGNVLMMSTTAGADANAAPKKEKSKGKKKEGDSKYSKTVLLPITSFDQRANSLKRLGNDELSKEYSVVIKHSAAVIDRRCYCKSQNPGWGGSSPGNRNCYCGYFYYVRQVLNRICGKG